MGNTNLSLIFVVRVLAGWVKTLWIMATEEHPVEGDEVDERMHTTTYHMLGISFGCHGASQMRQNSSLFKESWSWRPVMYAVYASPCF